MADIIGKLPVNWPIRANPVNWIVVWLMIAIACAGFAVLDVAAHYPSTQDN